MVSSQTLMYVGMGVGYAILFIVVGTFLVLRQRRIDDREKVYKESSNAENSNDEADQDTGRRRR